MFPALQKFLGISPSQAPPTEPSINGVDSTSPTLNGSQELAADGVQDPVPNGKLGILDLKGGLSSCFTQLSSTSESESI